jgi:hypothetical protein
MQANANVALLPPAADSRFASWLRRSTLEPGQPVWRPVPLAPSHRQALAGTTRDAHTTLTRTPDGWWLTRSYEETVPLQTPTDAPVLGRCWAETGHYPLPHHPPPPASTTARFLASWPAKRHQRDRQQRRRKAKRRACLKQTGVQQLPSPRNRTRARQVRQERNRAVNARYQAHPAAPLADEHLQVAGLRDKARRLQAYLYASNRAHIPAHLVWGAATRGVRARRVRSASSSQACQRCHAVARQNRPSQHTGCGGVCGRTTPADVHAAENLASCLFDQELAACADRAASTARLDRRHQAWRVRTGWPSPNRPPSCSVNGRRATGAVSGDMSFNYQAPAASLGFRCRLTVPRCVATRCGRSLSACSTRAA